MRKKMVCWLIVIALLLTLLPGAALAANDGAVQCGGSISIVSWFIQKVQAMKLQLMVDQANRQIDLLVRKAQRTPYNDVPQLLWQVDLIVKNTFAYADSIGAVLECEYVEYWIDGQSVLIDPIRIVRL